MGSFYQIPADFAALSRGGQLKKSGLIQSIREFIYLLLLTKRSEWRFDDGFQCLLWDKDFEQTDSLNLWLDDVRDSIRFSIQQYETRLRVRNVDIQKDELQEKNREDKTTRVRNRLNIRVSGTIIETGEDFDDVFLMFFGPVAVV